MLAPELEGLRAMCRGDGEEAVVCQTGADGFEGEGVVVGDEDFHDRKTSNIKLANIKETPGIKHPRAALAGMLEEGGHVDRKKVRALAGGTPKAQRIFDRDNDRELRRFQNEQRGRACPGCGQTSVGPGRSRKGGPNQGRIFASCYNCNFFEWLTDPIPTEDAPVAVPPPPRRSITARWIRPRNSPRASMPSAPPTPPSKPSPSP